MPFLSWHHKPRVSMPVLSDQTMDLAHSCLLVCRTIDRSGEVGNVDSCDAPY
ncbi:protein of unknown function (plasmid) [Rhodovastum atsumiense]|nr:protein of unknown function [Rhodovastum atsumiense]